MFTSEEEVTTIEAVNRLFQRETGQRAVQMYVQRRSELSKSRKETLPRGDETKAGRDIGGGRVGLLAA